MVSAAEGSQPPKSPLAALKVVCMLGFLWNTAPLLRVWEASEVLPDQLASCTFGHVCELRKGSWQGSCER